MKCLLVFVLFISTALCLNGEEARSDIRLFAEKYLLKSGEKFAVETMKLASVHPQLAPAEDTMLLQIFVRMNYDDYNFSELDKFSRSNSLRFSQNWRSRWKNDWRVFEDFKHPPVIVEFKREALSNGALGSWVDACAVGERRKWTRNSFSQNLIFRCIEEWTIARAIEPITSLKDTANEFCEPYEAEIFLYWLAYVRLADVEGFCELSVPYYFARFFDPSKIKDPLRRLKKEEIFSVFFEKNYLLWVDEYREYMLALKTLVKPVESEDSIVGHNRAIKYTLRRIGEWNSRDRR